jgi:hypothetical protein
MRRQACVLAAFLLATGPGCCTYLAKERIIGKSEPVKRGFTVTGVTVARSEGRLRPHVRVRLGDGRVLHVVPGETEQDYPWGDLPESSDPCVVALKSAKEPMVLAVGDPIRRLESKDGSIGPFVSATAEDLNGAVVFFHALAPSLELDARGHVEVRVAEPRTSFGWTSRVHTLDDREGEITEASVFDRKGRWVCAVTVSPDNAADLALVTPSPDVFKLVDKGMFIPDSRLPIVIVESLDGLVFGARVRRVNHREEIVASDVPYSADDEANAAILELRPDPVARAHRVRWKLPGGGPRHADVVAGHLRPYTEGASASDVARVGAFVLVLPFTVAVDVATSPVQIPLYLAFRNWNPHF